MAEPKSTLPSGTGAVPLPAWIVPALRGLALAAGLLGLVMAVLVLITSLRLTAADPVDSAALRSLKERVAADGADEALYRDIRTFDLLARTAYFTSQEQITAGTVIFIAAWALALGCLQLASLAGRRSPPPPLIRRDPLAAARLDARFRAGTAIIGAFLLAACLASLILVPREAWEPGGIPPAAPKTDTAAFDQAWAGQWGVFRGPRAGIAIDPQSASEMGAFSAAWRQGTVRVLWESPLDTPGLGSPVVWDQTLFLNAADAGHQLVIAFDTTTGQHRWTADLVALVAPPAGKPDISPDSGLATPSMCCDAEREYVLFPTGRLACLDRQGKLVWSKELGLPENSYGLASSLALFRDRLIVQYDQTGKSVISAFDAQSGRALWETVRESEAAWSSPLVVPTAAGARIIVAGNPNLAAFKAEDGSLAWQFPILGGEVAPSPAWYGDAVYVANQYALAAAVPLAEAEAGKPMVRWEYYDDLPDIASPLASAQALVFCASRGLVTALAPRAGTLTWHSDCQAGGNANPLQHGPLYLVATTTGSLVALDGGSGQAAWSLKLGAAIKSTPAWHGGRLFVRTEKSLLALGEP